MKKDKIAQQLSDILPDRPITPTMVTSSTQLVDAEAERLKIKQDAKEIARIKYKEKSRLANLKQREKKYKALAEELGVDEIPDGRTEIQARKIAEQEKRVEAVEALEAQIVEPLDAAELANLNKGTYSKNVARAIQLQGASRPEIIKLLTSLNINLNVQLSKQDTTNLLACLLTCNESQLVALQNNKKVPVVIKTVIKRLIEDMKLGNIKTVEKLWDRIFGKGNMQVNLPQEQQLQTGIIPNVPISREAYIVIRDTLIK